MQLDLPLGGTQLSIDVDAGSGRRTIAVDVLRSARRRRLALLITLDGRIEVRAPLAARQSEIVALLDEHRRWLARKLGEQAVSPRWQVRWGPGGDWYWQGEPVALQAAHPAGLHEGRLQLPLRVDADGSQWRRRVLAWHREATRSWLDTRIAALFAHHYPDDQLERIDWRWMRATWGTCRARRLPDGRRTVALRFNPWLGALPESLAMAVVLHELAHVRHMNHGVRFHQWLARLDPDCRANDKALTEWARRLFPALDAQGTSE